MNVKHALRVAIDHNNNGKTDMKNIKVRKYTIMWN